MYVIEIEPGKVSEVQYARRLTGNIIYKIPGLNEPIHPLFIDLEGNLVATNGKGTFLMLNPVDDAEEWQNMLVAAATAKNGPSPALPELIRPLTGQQLAAFYDRLPMELRLAVIRLLVPAPLEVPVTFVPAAPE